VTRETFDEQLKALEKDVVDMGRQVDQAIDLSIEALAKRDVRATYLLWATHNLERIADRAINIGERVVFLVRGEVEEHNA
jgi:phosphate transport system protein